MADETLDTLPQGGKLPDTLPAHPDSALACAWAAANGGRIGAYALTGTTPNLKATLAGFWVGSAPMVNPYGTDLRPSLVPPQWREVKDRSAFDLICEETPAPTAQPDWNWNPLK